MWCSIKPLCPILGLVPFKIFVNDLKKSIKLLDPIMFADDNNLFYTSKGKKVLFVLL